MNTQQTIPEFAGFIDDTGPAPLVLDRSTGERWCTCPRQGWFVDNGGVSNSSFAAESGTACHAIIAAAIKARHKDGAQHFDIRQLMTELAAKSRPDLQPDVLSALTGSAIWKIADIICRRRDNGAERHADDAIRYQGGEGEHSGQLAADLTIK
jgi:hypothetical protein